MEITREYNGRVFIDYISDIEEGAPNSISDIERLKSELQESDYKVIKCAEAICLNAEMPYDMTELHNERQALRDKVNELEKAVGAAKGIVMQ